MTIVELKNKINELDKLMDDESINNKQFDEYGRKIARLYAEIAKIEARQELVSVRHLNKVSDWGKQFLSSFGCGTRKVTIRQAQVFERFNNGKPFIYDGKRFDCESPNYRNGFSCLVVRAI